MQKALVVLPTYNESKNIAKLLKHIFKVGKNIQNWELHVLVVDSSSPDGTNKIVSDLQKKYSRLHLLETRKEGLGKAYLRGFSFALESLKPGVFFEMDADLSHNPDDIPAFLDKIENGADFVVGSRYIPGGSIPRNWGIHRKVFSIIGNLIVRLGFMRLSVTEWTNGYRAIRSWLVSKHLDDLKGYTGYVFQVAFLDNAINSGAVVKEIPVHFVDRVEGVSKINSFEYILHTLLYVFTHSSFIKFVIVGAIGFVIDFGISFVGIEITKSAVWKATLLSTETAIISNFLLNNFWAFSYKKLEHSLQTYFVSFLKFNLISSGSIVIQTVGVFLATLYFGQGLWWLYKMLIITFIIIPYSYIFYNAFIWKK